MHFTLSCSTQEKTLLPIIIKPGIGIYPTKILGNLVTIFRAERFN